jgi:hypothetical protein
VWRSKWSGRITRVRGEAALTSRTNTSASRNRSSGGAPNAHAQRPEGEQREPPVRWSVMLGSPTSVNDLVRS